MADFYTYKGDIRPFGNGSPVAYHVDPLVDNLEQGELVGWNAAEGVLRRMTVDGTEGTSTTQSLVFVGVTRDSQERMKSLGNHPALLDIVRRISVFTTGIHMLRSTNAQTYRHGDAVQRGNANDRVALLTTGVQVGTIHLPDGSTISGDGNNRVPVLIDEHTVSQQA